MTARTIAGLPLGAFTVVVGQDDHALEQALFAACGRHRMAQWGLPDYQAKLAIDEGCMSMHCLFDSLHPARIPAAMAALRAAGVPVVATTHNVYVLDACDPGEVLVLHDGQVARLSEHPQARNVALSAGQLWTLDDEATWVPAAVERRRG